MAAATIMPVQGYAKAPLGYVQFCQDFPADCAGKSGPAGRVVLSRRTFRELDRVNRLINTRVQPRTDIDLYGVPERWTYPSVNAGDCEDYVLLKRKLLMEAGFPRQALLITVVRDRKGEGHAVLTVTTDQGDYVLDNQVDEILPWQDTDYRYVKRQSDQDQNLWVLLGDPAPNTGVAAMR